MTPVVTEADRIRVIRQVLASPANHGLSPADMAKLIVDIDPIAPEVDRLRNARARQVDACTTAITALLTPEVSQSILPGGPQCATSS